VRADRLRVLAVLALSLGCGVRPFLHLDARSLSPDAWVLLGGGANSLVVTHGVEAFAADPKLGDFALRERRMVQEELNRKVRRALVTSSHLDHWGGLVLYPEVGAVLAHPDTRDRIAAYLHAHRRPPITAWVPVRTELRLVLGQQEVWVRFLGAGNTDGDLAVFVPNLSLVMTGDLFCQGFEPSADPSAGGSLLGLRRALDAMLGYDFQEVLPGHGPLATRRDVVAALDYLAAMEAAARDAVAKGLSEDAAVGAGESALRRFPRLVPLPLQADRTENLRRMVREVQQERQAGTSTPP
jgi:cyclase